MISELLKSIKPSPTIAVANLAKQLKADGKEIFDFTVGESDFLTPNHIKKAVSEALDYNETRYTLINGTKFVRQAISDKLKRENNLDYSIDEICITNGAKQSIFNTFLASLNPDDEVIIINPAWVSYVDIVKLARGKPVEISTKIEDNFAVDLEILRKAITKRTKWIMFNSPSNPTGMMYTKEQLRKIADVLLAFPGAYILSDEIYEHIAYDGQRHVSILEIEPELYNRTVIVNGASKAYSMTGFRIGYCAVKDKELLKAINIVQSQATSCANSIGQYAFAVALNDSKSAESIAVMRDEMEKRRNYIYEQFKKSGLKFNLPNGAFYFFVDISQFVGKSTKNGSIISSDIDFCEHVLSERGVALVAGSSFGAPNYFRLSFSYDMETIAKGIDALLEFCSTID